ncbi:MAG: cupin domain-containing protein [Paludibacteraceae bacterium]|nr:cupin domain-containing protein [Paludibacteraceae bacterium]
MRKKIDCHTETIESVELIRTSTSWNGTSLPDYPQGKPELVAVKYIIPPGQKLGWHHHIAMNHGVLIQGELTVVGLDGQTKVFREGDVIVEMVEDIHHGENQGATTVILYMFYLAQENMPLSVQHPEIPIK